MPVVQRYKATTVKDPAAAVTALEARAEFADAKVSGHFGSDIQSEISTNLVHFVVTSTAEADSTTDINAIADAIDLTAVAASTLDEAIADAEVTTITITDAGFVTWLAAAITAGGTPTIKIESEVLQVTAAPTAVTLTVVRGAEGSTAASHADTTAVALYVGTGTDVIPLDDPTKWGATGPADDYLVLICGTEQMKVDCDSIDGTNDFLLVTRGYDSTTAAIHADDAVVTQYIDETTTQFDVDSGAALTQGKQYKTTATGQEIWTATTVSTNRVVATRGAMSTTAAVMADNASVYRVYGEVDADVAIAALGGYSEFGAQDFTVSLPSS